MIGTIIKLRDLATKLSAMWMPLSMFFLFNSLFDKDPPPTEQIDPRTEIQTMLSAGDVM